MALGLQDILQKKKELAERSERPKVDYFGLKENSFARIAFLQELNDKIDTYDELRGKAIFLVEHTSPYNFKRRAECTLNEEEGGRCFACEMNVEEPDNNWWSKINAYIQIFDFTDNKVKVLSRAKPEKEGSFFDQLIEWSIEENEGRITDRVFKVSKGDKKSSWGLMPSTKVPEFPEDVEIETVDLESAVGIKLEYEKQRKFYIPSDATSREDEPEKDSPKPKQDDPDW